MQQSPADTRLGEIILGCEFRLWREALEVSDMFTVAAIGRLLAQVASVKV